MQGFRQLLVGVGDHPGVRPLSFGAEVTVTAPFARRAGQRPDRGDGNRPARPGRARRAPGPRDSHGPADPDESQHQ